MDETIEKYLLRDKLERHEAPVDPADWDIIRRRLQQQKHRKTAVMWLPASAAAAVALFFSLYQPSGVGRLPVVQPIAASLSLSVAVPGEVRQSEPVHVNNITVATRKTPAPLPENKETTHPEMPATASMPADTVEAVKTVPQIAANDKTEKAGTPTQLDMPNSLLTFPLTGEEEVRPGQAGRKKWALALLAGQSGAVAFPNSAERMYDYAYALNDEAPGSFTGSEYDALNNPTETTHHVPLSFGVTFRFYFTSHWAIESGLVYTYLSSEYKYANDYRLKQQLHYLGLPVNAVYQFVGSKRFSVYLSGGGMLEKGVGANYTLITPASRTNSRESIAGLQWSLNGQLGGSYHLSKRFSLYVEPGIRYFFPDARQPENVRTEQPFNFTLGFGVRANF
ncbi:MAG: PorT family protein [Prevotellaceae bacterium]|jgi:hypothetical protein|nr:PorT family protein [Prevotellaceae bacterium]